MSENETKSVVRNGISGEEVYHKLSALGTAYTSIANAGDPFGKETTYGLYLLYSQVLEELKQFVYGKEEGKPEKDGE